MGIHIRRPGGYFRAGVLISQILRFVKVNRVTDYYCDIF